MVGANTSTFRPSVGIVGAGRFGLALAEIIARNGHDVVLYTSLSERAKRLRETRRCEPVLPELEGLNERVTIATDPHVIASRCTLIVVTVSTEYFMKVLQPVGEALDGAHQLVHAVHTLVDTDLRRVSTLVQRHSCVRQLGVIAGPTHVSELLSGMPNAAVVGSAFPAVIRSCQHYLSRENFRIYGNPDLRGVELAAALGQVVAIAVGLADGLQLGAATHATLLTRGMNEMARLGARLGATEKTFSGLAGVGRLVDAVRRGEPNYQIGVEMATSNDPAGVAENAPPEAQGLDVIRRADAYAKSSDVSLPIVGALARVICNEWSASDAMIALMQLEQMDE